MRISKEPEERKQEIVDTAMKLFCEKGYEKTSISDIAKEMNVAQGLLYRYFSSKEVLFDTVIEQYAQQQVSQITSILKKKDMTLLQIVKEMPTFVEAEEENSYMKQIFHGPDSKEIHMRLSMSICAKMQPIVQKLLEESKSRGEIHIQDTATAASFCVYGQLGILLNQEITREERVERIKSFLITILKAL